ncbi:MAG: hypothetical protein DHS20C13_29320 [Thermodesulfobacteriota bacterium]|nr:MAG: hypothetical protein DHS20C13_29320 [Thermodesulfobacteriota bacterium]
MKDLGFIYIACYLLIFFGCGESVKYYSNNYEIEKNTKEIEKNPNNDEAYNMRGVARLSIGNCSEALKDFESAIRIKENISEYYSNRGRAYNCLGNFKLGIQDCRQAIKLDSLNLYAHTNYSWGLLHTNQFEESIRHAQIVINKNTINKELNAMAYNNKGSALMMMKNYNEAKEALKKSTANNPNNELPFVNLGQINTMQLNFKESQINFDKALKINSQSKEAFWGLGNLNLKLGKTDKACTFFKKAIELGANYTDTKGESYESFYKKICKNKN